MPTSPTDRGVTKSTRGFTLIEILLVLAVLGLMASLVVARMDLALPSYRLRSAARDIASTVIWARSESIARAQPVEVRYDLGAATYRVVVGEADTTPGLSERDRGSLRPQTLPEGVRFADCTFLRGEVSRSGMVTVRFSFLGGCEGHLIHLTDAGGNFFTVEVLPLGVQVNLYDFYKEAEDAPGQ